MNFHSFDQQQAADVEQLFGQVFSDSEGEAEGQLLATLVNELITTTKAADLKGFVASDDQLLIAAIFFTPLKFQQPIQAFLLSPVAVKTSHQGQGIGQQLIKFGIEQLKQQGAELLITYGDPNFYGKTGFQSLPESVIQAPLALSYPHGWLGQSLLSDTIPTISDKPSCVQALNNPIYW
ncbi:N-acetyltransferase [Neiella sp. HB171785]|uniref:N-acetyltransferase n=2 Tax=Neiella litorisoli TaxID=2771431 RepID=A0A8J6QGM7_9GAMM|nr:N-acetyltransferase [Neiella litorisoli]MBD1387953.1 N-acetyltransferase [Neiella litorisoli]